MTTSNVGWHIRYQITPEILCMHSFAGGGCVLGFFSVG